MRAWDLATSVPWAVTEDALEVILKVAGRDNLDPEAVAARLGRPLVNTYRAEVRDGVAILPVAGPLFRYANLFTELSGATSVELLAKDLRAALDNPNVRAILLNIDSPGGEVSGVSEFARMVYEARKEKDVVAYISNLGASGGYWIASAANEVVIADTAVLGSIGVLMTMRVVADDPKVKTVRFVSSMSPKKVMDPATNEGAAEILKLVDALGQVFVDAVAEYRNTTPERVAAEFGQGGVFVGQAAVAAGLADRVGSFETVLAELVSGQYRRTVGANTRAEHSLKEVPLDPKPKAEGDAPAPATTEETPVAEVPTVALITEKHPAIAAAFREEGAKAEAERRDKLAAMAKGVAGVDEMLTAAYADRSVTPGAFAESLVAKQKAAGTAKLDALKTADEKLAAVKPGATAADGEGEATVESLAQSIIDTGKKHNHPSTATGQR